MADRAAMISGPLDVVESAASMLWMLGCDGGGVGDGRREVVGVLLLGMVLEEAAVKDGSREREDVDANEASLDRSGVELRRNSSGGTDDVRVKVAFEVEIV